MKLPTAESKGLPLKSTKTQDTKTHSVSPLKQLVRKLSGSASTKSSSAKSPKTEDVQTTDTDELKISSVKSSKGSKGIRVAFTLLLVRPWVLVLGFWLFSMLGAALALEGMISPRKLTMALPEPAQIAPVRSSSLIDVEQAESGDIAADEVPLAEASELIDGTAERELDSSSNFPMWTLGGVVGTCAAGCLVMSRRRAMARMAVARARGRVRRVRVSAAPSMSSSSTGQKGGQAAGQKTLVRKPSKSSSKSWSNSSSVKKPQKLSAQSGAELRPVTVSKISAKPEVAKPTRAKKRRQRNNRGAVVTQQGTVSKSRRNQVLASRSTARPSAIARPSHTRSARRSPSRMASRQSVVSVVPANESHALDWSSGSLAHQVDVRPQRTASM